MKPFTDVNTFFHKSRIGILLSYALMMTIASVSCESNVIQNEPMGIESLGITGDQSWQQEDSEGDLVDTPSILNILQTSLSVFGIQSYEISNINSISTLEIHTIYSSFATVSSSTKYINRV